MVTYEDFREWYADNTDADYDDICLKVSELFQTIYREGFDAGWYDGFNVAQGGERESPMGDSIVKEDHETTNRR